MNTSANPSHNTALLIIDMQAGNFTGDMAMPAGETLVAAVRGLLDRARAADVPVIFIQNDGPQGGVDEPGTPGWEIDSRLEPLPGEVMLRKTTPDSFHETGLEAELAELGVERLVICGLQTEYCVDTTVRRAFTLGYDVTLVQDAHGTWDGAVLPAPQIIAHHNSVLGGWFAKLARAESVCFD